MEKHKSLLAYIFVASFLISFLPWTSRAEKVGNETGDTATTSQKGAPVAPFGKTIFRFPSGVGAFSPELRAKAVEMQIKNLAGRPFFSPDSMHMRKAEWGINIVYEKDVVSVVLMTDTVGSNQTLQQTASRRMMSIVAAIEEYREDNRGSGIIRSIIYSVAFLGLLILLFYLVNRISRFFRKKIFSWKNSDRKILSIAGYEFLDKKRQVGILLFFNNFLRAVLFLLLLVAGLLIMFLLLPWTKPFTMQVLDVILSPVKHILSLVWRYIPNLIIIIVVMVITYFINRFFRFLKREIERNVLNIPGFYPEWALPTYNIIRVVVWIFTIIVIWPYIPGSDSKIFQGISVFLGLVFSFTSASLITNIMSGFSLTYTRAFHLGDRVRIGDSTGDVIEKSMLVTKLRTIKNEEVTIPNSKIMSSEVINYSSLAKENGLIVHSSVTIGYDAPWRKIHELLIRAALETRGILEDPAPFVLQTSLDDFYISYQINGYTQEPNRLAEICSLLHQNIQDQFNAAGMEIMSPHYKAVRDGNTIAIPEENRGKDYHPPAFRIEKK